MKITIESTMKIVELVTPTGRVPARIWEGQTERGTPVSCFVTRIAPIIAGLSGCSPADRVFKADLASQRTPLPEGAVIDMRLIL